MSETALLGNRYESVKFMAHFQNVKHLYLIKAFYHFQVTLWFVFLHIFPLIYIPAKETPSSEQKQLTPEFSI